MVRQPEGKGFRMSTEKDTESKLISKIRISIRLPDGFPEKYEKSVVKAANLCAVKKHLAKPPEFEIVTRY